MNTSQLECFVSLAGTLNFVRTAEQLGLTQPAVSKQLKSLEEEMGAPLFTRTSRSVSLTAVGRQFLPEATDMLNIFYRSQSWIRSYSRSPLRIGYADPTLMQVIGTLLKALFSETPDSIITPEFSLDQTDANLGRLKNGQLDCVVGIRDARFDDPEIVFTHLKHCGFLCVVSKGHPLAAEYLAHPEKPREISSKTVWPYRQVVAIPRYLLKNSFSRGRHILPVNDDVENMICRDINEALAVVQTGIAYAMLPDYLQVENEELLCLKWQESPQALFGIYHRRSPGGKDPLSGFIRVAKKKYSVRRAD